jgi:lambda repressor-like predicted transcriptional regulator
MTAEMGATARQPSAAGSRRDRSRPGRAVRPVVGALPDRTPFYAPIGEVVTDGAVVTCHLCGRSLRSVTAHLRVHGWTKTAYCDTFGLERGQPLEGQETQKRRSASFSARLIFDPSIRAGSAAGRQRARAGDLTRDAARAAKGRPMPEQRRRKASAALASIPAEITARANRERADRHLAEVAGAVARQQGYPDLTAFVLARAQAGASMAAISREAGLNKDWLARHLDRIDPAAAAAARQHLVSRWDSRWQPALAALGFADVAAYLRDRHTVQHWSVHAIGAEAGLSHHAVETALRRHGLGRTAHAGKRHAAQQRSAQVAVALGQNSIAAYITQRRAAGWTWQAMSDESGQPPNWLRRQAAH